jgi:hypothetical protein
MFSSPPPFKRSRLNFGEAASPMPAEENPCEGISQRLSEGFNVNMASRPKIEQQCKFQKDGKFFRINTSNLKLDDLLAEIPVYDNVPTLDGVYTWILYDENKFASTKVTSIFEVGSVHQVLALRKQATRIIAAGELMIKSGQKAFNFISGTFMMPMMKSRAKKRTCSADELEDFLAAKMKTIFGADALKVDRTFIINPPTDAELDLYTRHGATIDQYNTVEECNAAQSAGRRRRKTLKRRNIKKRNTIRTKRSKRY